MVKITKDQIKEIAEQLDCGNRCFINKDTGDIKTTPDFDNGYADEELWADVLEELEENWDKYIQIEKMESHESFDLMTDFADSVDSRELRDSLINALNKKHPFRNFKWVVDNSGPYRQKWFDFKNQRLIEWVKDQIEVLDFEHENE
jgi:outer membrane cobalamin receptor